MHVSRAIRSVVYCSVLRSVVCLHASRAMTSKLPQTGASCSVVVQSLPRTVRAVCDAMDVNRQNMYRLATKFAMEVLMWNRQSNSWTGMHPSASVLKLMETLVECRADIVELLLKAGADINAQDVNCQTPLHLATNLPIDDLVGGGDARATVSHPAFNDLAGAGVAGATVVWSHPELQQKQHFFFHDSV